MSRSDIDNVNGSQRRGAHFPQKRERAETCKREKSDGSTERILLIERLATYRGVRSWTGSIAGVTS